MFLENIVPLKNCIGDQRGWTTQSHLHKLYDLVLQGYADHCGVVDALKETKSQNVDVPQALINVNILMRVLRRIREIRIRIRRSETQ